MEKEKIIIIATMMIMILSVARVYASDVNVVYDIQEEQIKPGDSTIISLTLSSIGGTTENIKIKPIQQGYLTISPGEISIDSLPISKTITESFVVSASNDAISGKYTIIFKIEYYDGSTTKYLTLSIPIAISGEPILHLKNYTVDKNTIHAGEDFSSKLTIINVGNGVAKDVFVTFNSSLIIPKTSTVYINQLSRNEEKQINLQFSVEPNTQPGTYPIPVIITYTNKDGSIRYTTQYAITIKVTEKGSIETYLESVSQYSENEKKVRIKFVNSADSQLKFIKVSLPDWSNPTNIYIGNLDSDDYSTEDVYIPINTTRITMNITYVNPLNKEITKTVSMDIPQIEFKNEQEKRTSIKNEVIVFFVGIAIGYGIKEVIKKK